MEEYSNKEQQKFMNNINVPPCRIVLILVFLFCLCTYVDISCVLADKPWHIFILINFIIFALFVLSSQKQFPDERRRTRRSRNSVSELDNVDSFPSLDEDEHCGGLEEIFIDKHVILVENAVGDVVSVGSDKSDEWLEGNHHHHHHHQRLEGRMSKELEITIKELPAWRLMDDMRHQELRFAIDAFIDDRKKVPM